MEIIPYTQELDNECLSLEALCPQGNEYRLSFVREVFIRRAANFDRWQVLIAKKGREIVGVSAVSVKEVEFKQRRIKAGFYFDLRVHPDHRRQGIAQKLGWACKEWALGKGAEYHYLYCIDDNRAMKALGQLVNGEEVGGYDLLVWPVYRTFTTRKELVETKGEQVHRECIAANGPYDLYSNIYEGGNLQGHLKSFRIEGAGCSIWSNKGIVEERVENIPGKYSIMKKIIETRALRRMKLPHLPGKGEVLKSLYVYDLYSRRAEQARELVKNVNNWALDGGYDYLYIVDPPGKRTIDDLRKVVPTMFAPKLRYCLISQTHDGLDRVYVDIRDL